MWRPAEGWLCLLGGVAGAALWLLSMPGCTPSVRHYPASGRYGCPGLWS